MVAVGVSKAGELCQRATIGSGLRMDGSTESHSSRRVVVDVSSGGCTPFILMNGAPSETLSAGQQEFFKTNPRDPSPVSGSYFGKQNFGLF